MDRFTSRANATVHFLDRDHILFTFNAKKLMRRLPECPPTHHDRIIHAAVLEVSSGKLVKEKDWYVHDYRPYLWELAPGRFLLRRLNSLYELDSELHEKLLRDLGGVVLWIGVTPDRKEIMVETALEGPPMGGTEDKQPETAAALPHAKVKIDFLNAATLAIEHTMQATGELELAANSFGYADSTHSLSRRMWLVRFGPSAEQRRNIARVKSRCAPDLAFPGANTLLIGRCSASSPAYSVSVFTLSGHPLWRQRWQKLNHFPQLEASADGSRFAVGTITAAGDADLPATHDENDAGWPSVQEDCRIFETASGKLVLSATAKSVILKNTTFSLSPDGGVFAMLDGPVLKIYNLPAAPAEERAKYLAMNADAPTLLAPATPTSADSDDVALDFTERPEDPDPTDADLSAALGITKRPPPETRTTDAAASQSAGSTTPQAGGGALPASFRTSAEEVVVDVVVTDARGHPVKGLSRQDFQVEEDGKLQTLNSFREFSVSAPETPVSVPGLSDPAPNVFTNNIPPRSSLPLTLVMLDFVNTPMADQQYAKQELMKFLKKKPRDMQFAIFVLSTNLSMIQGFTADENTLLASVNRKKAGIHYSAELQPNAGLSDMIRETKIDAQFNFATQFAVQQLQQLQYVDMAAQLDRRMARTVDAFNQLAGYLSATPGRKNLVWLSAAFPAGFLASGSLNADTPTLPTTIRKYDDEIRTATNSLAKSNIAVYPADVRGLSTDSIFSSAESGVNAMSVGAAGSQTPGPPGRSTGSPVAGQNTVMSIEASSRLMQEMEQSNDTRLAEQGTMDQIAEGTGGKAFYNTNGIQHAIETAVEQGSQYYVLSYAPQNRNYDGRFRKLKVMLARKGYHLAYRRGYYADDPNAPLRNGAQLSRQVSTSGMQHNAPEAHQLAFAVRVIPVGKPVKGTPSQAAGSSAATLQKAVEVQHYAVDYAVAGPQVHFEVNGGTRRAVLDFMASAYAEDGSTVAEVAFQTANTVKANVYRDVMIGGFRLHQELDVPTRAISLRLGVVDETTAHLGTIELPLPVKPPPDAPPARARSLPPVEPD